MGSSKLFIVALLCTVAVASATVVTEPFDVLPNGGTNWTSDWTEASATLHQLSIGSATPIRGGGNYLVYRTLTGTTVGANGLGRDFDTTVGEVIHTVKMNIRVDEFGNFFAGPDISDRMQIYGDAATGTADMGTYATWCVMTTATVALDNWYYYDGIRTGKWSSSYLKNTGLPIVPGGVYSLMVRVYPETLSYDVTMSNGTTTFTKKGAGFRAGPALPGDPPIGPSDRIGFGNKVRSATNGGSDVQICYDAIQIFPNGAYAPTPANNAEQVLVASPSLSWHPGKDINPADPNGDPIIDPNITGYYVYLSPANDPTLPTTPVYVSADADSNGQIDTVSTFNPSSLLVDSTYYWRVDTSLEANSPTDDPNLVKGVVWTFETETTDPLPYAGQNVVTYVQDGTATVNLAASIDWTQPQSSIVWSVESMPTGAPEGSIQFSSTSVEDPIVTISYVGKPYILKLTATDTAGGIGEDTMQIDVYADSCEAAQNVLGYQAIAGDINDDCKVDMDDLSLIAENWLEFNYLTANYLY